MRRILALVATLGLMAGGAYAAGFVFVATPLNDATITNAEQLADDIPNCSVVAYWNTASQGWIQHPNNSPINNFAVSVSKPYMATVTADGIWTLCGGVPDSTTYLNLYQIAVGFSTIMLPLNMTYYTTAEQVIQSVPQCNNIGYWNAASQGWVQHPQGTPINNFAPKVGYPYMLTCQSAGTWPGSLPPAKAVVENETPMARTAGTPFSLGTAPTTQSDR